jgi:putative ABC transport system permease protein
LVTRRIKELGVRVALGATRTQILGLVIGSALRLALIGIAIGTVAALAAGRLVAAWLYGIQSHDAPTIGGVCLMLLIVAVFACYFRRIERPASIQLQPSGSNR